MKIRVVIIALVLVALAAASLKLFYLKSEFLYAGTLEATKVDLSTELSSTIASVKVESGDHVDANQELVTLSCEDFYLSSRLANQNLARAEKLFKTGSSTQEALDQVKNAKEQADLKLKWCSLRAPISGTVLSRYHEPGEWANPGLKILTLANVKDIWTYIYVPQPEVAKLSLGMKVKAVVAEISGREFVGTIVKISSEAEFTPKNVQTQSERTRLVYGVKVSFLGANDDERLKPGMTIEMPLPKD